MITLGHSNVWDKKDVILKNKAEKLLITKVWLPKTRLNKPKNKPGDVVEKKEGLKNKPERNLPVLSSVT